MNKKRYLIIIILLIFLFLTIFSFANPFGNGEGEPNDNRVLEEIEEEDLINKEEQEETNKVDTPNYNDHGVNVTDKEEVKEEDNSYELALEAVKKAEVTLDKDNYDKALELVNKVTDSDKKEELEERLEEVLNSINVKELVEKLVKTTKSSTNREELDAARKFNTSNEISDKISNLSNEVLKSTLEKAVDSIAYLLDDITVPTINIEDGAILNSDTKIEAEDENELILVLNGTEIENNHVVTDGEYELVVIDAAFNEIKISFVVDTNAPVGTLTYDAEELTNKDVTVILTTNEDVTITNNNGKFEYTFEENGEFTFEFVDVAGNKGSAIAKVDYIDKEKPQAEVAYSIEELTNTNVIVKLTLSEKIKEVEGWTLSENKMTLTKELEANEEGKVTIEDLAGNTNKIEYSVTNIDTKINKPVITYSTQDPTNKNVVVTLTADEEVEIINSGTWNPNGGYGKVFKKAYPKNTTQTVTVRDKAGNETTVEVEFTNIDKEINKPVISYSTQDPTNKNVVVTLTADEEVEIINSGTWNPNGGYGKVFKKAYPKNTKQTVTIRDKAGNETTVEVEITNIDTKINKPVISYSTVDPTNKNVVVTLTADEEVEIINSGTWNPKEGYGKEFKKAYPKNTKQTVTVRDKAGNETTVEVEITNIDTEINEPTVTYSTEELTNQNVIVTITFDEEIKEVEGWTLSEDKMILTKELETNEEGKVIVEDLAGNTQEVNYGVTNIDKKAPIVTGVRNGQFYKEATPIVEDENLESIKLNGIEIKSGKKILLNGNYTLVATDKAGNTTTVTFTVDSIKPIILVLDFLDVIKTDLIPIKPVIIDANLDTVVVLKNGEDIGYKQGDQLEGEGTYEIFATDKAGNEAYTKFNADNKGPEIKKDYGVYAAKIPVIGGVYKEVKIKIDDENFDEKSIIVLKKSNESIDLPFDYSLPKYKKVDYKYGDTLTEEGEYIVLAADKALNISFASFIIDTTAPIINAQNNAFYESLQLNIEDASLLYTEVSKMNSEGNYEITDYQNGDLIEESGKYKVSATDKVLQNTTVEFTIDKESPTIITSTLPTVVAAEDGKTISVSVTVIDDADLDKTILPTTITHSNLENITVADEIPATEDYAGIYTLVYETTDSAGHPSKETVEIKVVRSDVVIKINATNNVYNGKNQLPNITAHLEDKNHNKISTNEGDIEIIAYKLNGNDKEVTTDLTNVGTYKIVASMKEEKVGYEIVQTEIEYTITPAKLNTVFSDIKADGTVEITFKNQTGEFVTGVPYSIKYYVIHTSREYLQNLVEPVENMNGSDKYYLSVVDVEPTKNYELYINDEYSNIKNKIGRIPLLGKYIISKLNEYVSDLSEVKLYEK